MREQSDARLIVPPLPPMHVSRPRLLAELERVHTVPLTMLAAGPGAGKTVLLSEWARRQSSGVAWLAATAAENDPRRFWRLFLAALHASGCVDPDALPMTLPGADPADLLESLFATTTQWPASVTLVIDDAHVLTHPAIVSGLDRIVRGWHPQLRLVLAARCDVLLALHRYRLDGTMLELRAAQLAMTDDEGAALLAAHGVSLPDDAFAKLMARTEGWTTGLRLSAMRMAGTERPADFVAELAVDQGSIGEYLMEEVLDRQPANVRRVLIETSFLDEVTGPLAEAVTGIDGCAELLTELARSNAFVHPLDAARTRFRSHQLLSEILRYLLRRRGRETERRLYARAASWYASEGDLRNALTWAAAASDTAGVVDLLVNGGLAKAYVERLDLSGCGLSGLDDVFATGAADLAAARAAIAAIHADRTTAATELGRLTRGAGADAAGPKVSVTLAVAELILAEKAGDAVRADEAATRVLAVLDQTHVLPRIAGLRASMLLARARSAFWDGRDGDADAFVDEARRLAEVENATAVELRSLGLTAFSSVLSSRPNRAADARTRAAELQENFCDLTASASLNLADALDAYFRGDIEATGRAVQLALAGPAPEWDAGVCMLTGLLRAQQLMRFGQIAEARTLLLHDLKNAGRPGTARLGAWRDLLLATIEVELGRPNTAMSIVQPYRGSTFDVALEAVRVKAHLATGDLPSASNCLRRALTGDNTHVNRYLLVDLTLCGAHLALREQDPARAIELVVRALDLSDGAIVLPFTRTADVFAPLLSRHRSIAARWPGPLGNGSDDADGVPASAPSARLADPLTERERTILRLLATSLTTAEIADELCVSINTVKTHLAAIYRKLAARKRREAVVRAREYELI